MEAILGTSSNNTKQQPPTHPPNTYLQHHIRSPSPSFFSPQNSAISEHPNSAAKASNFASTSNLTNSANTSKFVSPSSLANYPNIPKSTNFSNNSPKILSNPNYADPPFPNPPTTTPPLPSAASYYSAYLNMVPPLQASPSISRSNPLRSSASNKSPPSIPLSYRTSSTFPLPPSYASTISPTSQRNDANRSSFSTSPLSLSKPTFTPLKRPSNNPKDYLAPKAPPLSFPSLPLSPALPLAPPSLLTSPDNDFGLDANR